MACAICAIGVILSINSDLRTFAPVAASSHILRTNSTGWTGAAVRKKSTGIQLEQSVFAAHCREALAALGIHVDVGEQLFRT